MSPSLRYELVHDPANWVTVDEHSGAVVARQRLDRESPHVNNGVYVIIVHAVDEGKCSPKSGESVSLLLQENNTVRGSQPTWERQTFQRCARTQSLQSSCTLGTAAGRGSALRGEVKPTRKRGQPSARHLLLRPGPPDGHCDMQHRPLRLAWL